MITPMKPGVSRVTVTLDPVDVELIDRLSSLEGSNRSAVLRSLLLEVRPVITATVEAFERAIALRSQMDEAAATAFVSDLQSVKDRADKIGDEFLGVIATLEGLEASDPRRSNHGGHTPTPLDLPNPTGDDA